MTNGTECLENGDGRMQKYGKYSWLFIILLVLASTNCTFENSDEKKAREVFGQSLNMINTRGIESIKLSEITQFEWETVCDVHPYGGELFVEKYNRTYVGPSSEAHDGAWVLAFIAHDGTPRYVYTERKIGVFIVVGPNVAGSKRCYSKDSAVLKKDKPHHSGISQYMITEEYTSL